MTDRRLLQMAKEIAAEAARVRDRGDKDLALGMFGWAEYLRLYVEELQEARKKRTIIPNMEQTATATPRRRGRPTQSTHPFPVALEALGQTVTEWALAHRLDREMVKSWFAKGKGGRRIPLRWAKVIEKELGVSATDASWPNGIR